MNFLVNLRSCTERVIRSVVFTAVFLVQPLWGQAELQIASLGDFQLQSGEVIQDLSIGFRTMGELNEARSNAVLFPSWFTGTSEDLMRYVGPDQLVDPSRYFVILVDAIGDGVSSSPSNSVSQPGMQFPHFTIADMVNSQHRLLTGHLNISQLHAVIGVSMGGMQAFQWIVSYPDFVNKAIPIHGTPKQTTYDLLQWTAEVRVIQSDPAWRGGEYTAQPLSAMKTAAAINALALTTPGHRNRETPPEEFSRYLDRTARRITQSFDANNWIRQAQAMMANDISKDFGGSMEAAAAAVEAGVFVVVGLRDHLVNPQPALDFARLLFAPTLELESDCGHLAIGCRRETAFAPIRRFLEAE